MLFIDLSQSVGKYSVFPALASVVYHTFVQGLWKCDIFSGWKEQGRREISDGTLL